MLSKPMLVSSQSLMSLALLAAVAAAGCAPATVLEVTAIAERGDDPALAADVVPADLGAFVLYKSGACENPGADTCLDERNTGTVLAEAGGEGLLLPLEGDAFPSASFTRTLEASWSNVRFHDDAHVDARWSYGLLVLAPYDYHKGESASLDGASLDATGDDTPFAIGPMIVEARGVSDEELAARGLNPTDDKTGESVTLVAASDGAEPFVALDAKETVHFTVATLGSLRAAIAYPASLFDGEERLAPAF